MGAEATTPVINGGSQSWGTSTEKRPTGGSGVHLGVRLPGFGLRQCEVDDSSARAPLRYCPVSTRFHTSTPTFEASEGFPNAGQNARPLSFRERVKEVRLTDLVTGVRRTSPGWPSISGRLPEMA